MGHSRVAKALRFTMTGNKATMARLGLVGRYTPRDMAKALVRKGEEIIGDAKDMTPVKTGALKASGHVRLPKESPTGVVVDIGFGGPAGGGGANTEDVGYALPVHERTDVRHTVGGAKFLERAVEKHLPGMVGDFKRRMAMAIERRFGVINRGR